jgi:hypothetical protein
MNKVVGPLKKVSDSELTEIKEVPPNERKGMVVAGFADFLLKELVLFDANDKRHCAPFSMFKPSGDAYPDFDALEIKDYGHTIKLGKYEAASWAILYYVDPEYKAQHDANRMTK